MQLRKCCVHPSLLSPYPGIEHGQTLAEYVAASGKLALLDQMVRLGRRLYISTCAVDEQLLGPIANGKPKFVLAMLSVAYKVLGRAQHACRKLLQVGLLRERGHRILIYSQFTMLLDVLEDWLHQRKWPFFRLDGTIGMSKARFVCFAVCRPVRQGNEASLQQSEPVYKLRSAVLQTGVVFQ